MNAPELSRWQEKVDRRPGECWEWLGSLSPEGYGRFRYRGRNEYAHRVAYEHFRGAIPPGLHLDHLCRHRSCVNPMHLEPVTETENIQRGEARGRAHWTHCRHGHELAGENLYVKPNGHRQCRACARERNRKYMRALRSS